MKTIVAMALLIILSVAGLALVGCGAKTGVFGQPVSGTTITPIGDILARPEQFDKKTVLIEGRIIEECPAGGWFMLKDATGIIYVDIHPSYFAIPQAVGAEATAEGVVKKEGPRALVIGKGVRIK